MDGESYDGEIHLVHYNNKYHSLAEAQDKPDGLAVIGIFMTLGAEDHQEFEKIFKRFNEIEFTHDTVELEDDINIYHLLPGDISYWTYPGSLTTPPLFESVTWIVLKQTIQISHRQAGSEFF